MTDRAANPVDCREGNEMIKLNNSYGQKVFLAPSAVAEVLEAGASSQWHGIRAYVRTFDGRTIEVRESASDIVTMLAGKQGENK